jgi:hypothetical protein
MKLPLALLSIASLFIGTGCTTYQLGANHDPGYKTIFIENFKSEVDEPALENLVTTTVIQQFQRDGTLQVTDAAKADVILRGSIVTFNLAPVRFSRANELTPTETSLSMVVKYSLTKRGAKSHFQQGTASGDARFFIGNDLQSDKRQGVPLAAEKLGRQIVSAITEGW